MVHQSILISQINSSGYDLYNAISFHFCFLLLLQDVFYLQMKIIPMIHINLLGD